MTAPFTASTPPPTVDPVVVLESFGPPHDRTNPYSILLFDCFPDDVRAEYFSWGRALRGNYDVFHIHWPEVKVRGSTPLRSVLRGTAFLLVLIRIRLGRRALVRSFHDARPHEAPTAPQRWVLSLCDRWTTLWITLNDVTPPPTPAPVVLVPHGHYRDWFDVGAPVTPVPGRLLNFGLVRRYKGVDRLIRAFRELPDPDLSLHIVGRVEDDGLQVEIDRACSTDDRISAVGGYVPDDELSREVRESELVVLPFSRITNSGSLLLALSLDRPALAPSVPSIREVADEVGPGWVRLYDGELDAATLTDAIAALRAEPVEGRPDLSRRDWRTTGMLHAAAFRQARDLARRGRRFTGRRRPT